ncbi:phosphotransferase [Candidatus Reidiella endopervernicosa]|uniref:Phosphotransferase n=1 Tax=Candidatus Reidiella endopervernicosa TaxID=2738883 RepID=A0A6N0HTJ0_9GAMM|nr:phosphotransferase [Candidatus Reidiella endopervernicosa]QKQ25507.1 phosphotransferase [Candidatus Reidiella endopervernicosa]
MSELDLSQQRTLINHLHSQLASGEEAELIETHISWVILAGDYAYKLKKSIDFGFLDYSTLEKRRRQCEAELRLNNRTAANIYLDVVAIGGQTDAPLIDQQPAIEYMVKMHRFPQHALFSQQLKQKRLKPNHIDLLAEQVAEFHRTTERAAEDSEFGTPKTLFHPISENFEQIRERIDDLELLQRLQSVEQQSREFFETHQPLFTQRKADSFIRDCHGDLHLNNIILLDEKPQLFDCIEFNARLRIIDVISEIAFLVMDLQEHGADHLANQFLNRYLELSGDYEGVRLLPFYLSYRAMVRAKVATLRLDQTNLKHAQRQKSLMISPPISASPSATVRAPDRI